MTAFFFFFFRDRRQPKDPFTLSVDWNFKGKSKTDGTEREGQGGSRQCAHYSGRHSRPQEIAHFIFLVKLRLA